MKKIFILFIILLGFIQSNRLLAQAPEVVSCNVILNLTQPAALVVTCSKIDVTTSGGSDGAAGVTASGGAAPYTYLWSNNAITDNISGLVAGNYTVTVTDVNACKKICTSSVNSPGCGFTPTISGATPICRGDNSTLMATGGGTYLWSNGATTASITVAPIVTTTYTVTVTNGCSKTTSFVLVVRRLHVTNTNDTGEGTLRQAILCANYRASFDTITFDIPTSDPSYRNPDGVPNSGDEYWNIALAFADLPIVTDTLVINGLTQSSTDCNQVGNPAGATQVNYKHAIFPNGKGRKPKGIKLIVNGGGISNQQVLLSSSATLLVIKGLVFINWISQDTNGGGTIKLNPLSSSSKIRLVCSFMSNKIDN